MFASGSGPAQVVVPLPVVASKFIQPLRVDGPEFFRRWKGMEGKEKQKVFKLATMPLSGELVDQVLAVGIKFALLQASILSATPRRTALDRAAARLRAVAVPVAVYYCSLYYYTTVYYCSLYYCTSSCILQ